jgi:hypothetical protein
MKKTYGDKTDERKSSEGQPWLVRCPIVHNVSGAYAENGLTKN